MSEDSTRRPIRTRQASWAVAMAAFLAAKGVKPNWISVASVLAAALGGGCFLILGAHSQPWVHGPCLVAAAVLIQARLLCNLLDGMVAVEGGMKTLSGEVYNEFPDRLADSLLIVSAGYAIPWVTWAPMIGWLTGLLSVLTAYTRVMGVSCGAAHHFVGPMAKQHRMALLTAAALFSLVELAWGYQGRILLVALGVMLVGCLLTVMRRLRRIVRELEHAA